MEIFDIIKSVIFGIVEGITEWLPISSTGHMILLNEILPLRIGKNPDDFYSMFEVVIQLGAILAVVVLFWSQIWPFGRKNNKAPLAKTGVGAWVKTDIFVLWFHILVSTIPAAIIGVLFDDVFERLFYNFQTVAIMLILFGIAFIVIETRHNGKSAKIDSLVDISYTTALMIGIFQLIAAVFPGTSRSGATIVGALILVLKLLCGLVLEVLTQVTLGSRHLYVIKSLLSDNEFSVLYLVLHFLYIICCQFIMHVLNPLPAKLRQNVFREALRYHKAAQSHQELYGTIQTQ